MKSVPAPATPKQLGMYEVGAKIGGGGMATVYIGRKRLDDGSEERVALKVIRDELADDEQFKSMFIDEAKILSKLSHPNIIRTLEFGVTGEHRFIAMELLSGRTLADVWERLAEKNEPISPALAAWICSRIAEALHSAHEVEDEQGASLAVIHRDVNPTNIFLTHGGDAKLIDFGLAKAHGRVSKSADGIVKGKIPYLAPEQAHGRPIDRRIDVYALGATLWESVTLKRLFKRATDVDTLRAIREAIVPDVRTIVEGFPEPLWSIIEHALRKDCDGRYATAEAMRVELDAFVETQTSAEQVRAELIGLLERLFPGEQVRHANWERAATSVRMPMHTMPPPAPVPIVSTTPSDTPSATRPGEAPGHSEASLAPPAPPSSDSAVASARSERVEVPSPEPTFTTDVGAAPRPRTNTAVIAILLVVVLVFLGVLAAAR